MTEPTPDYHARAGMYRLLVGYGAMTLTGNPGGAAVYNSALDNALADPRLKRILNQLVGVVFATHLQSCGDDPKATVEMIVRELRAAEDLAGLDDQDGER
ncbi:hypothetical protein [Mycolicibacterium gilvum]|uniref:Uncharacterized protein n=1 Tax=Mycolicibacterium gilvum TaxID=1804 RepID=A0A378SGG9_9MYCO|nr:hypothetical protein [Mycolicibacterium gilvum]MCV7056287.1 hypothetical protein [Mycolicibacterium gilvum]STZ41711.1 Uncharacterised protein [Mycolicibacterium gilvum]